MIVITNWYRQLGVLSIGTFALQINVCVVVDICGKRSHETSLESGHYKTDCVYYYYVYLYKITRKRGQN